MIPDFKTYLKESVWSDMEDRGTMDSIKIENDPNNFMEDFKKILDSEPIDICPQRSDSPLFTPFNFGSDSYDKPGRYMKAKEIEELHNFLKKNYPEYNIMTLSDSGFLATVPLKTEILDGQYDSFLFEKDGKKLYLPNFGFMRFYSDGAKVESNKEKTYYGIIMFGGIGLGTFTGPKIFGRKSSSINLGLDSEAFQVRLVKKRHK